MTERLRIAIVDAGIGNLRSVQKGLEYVGVSPVPTDDPVVVADAHAVVLPGVASFGDGMAGLRARGLDNAILAVIERGVPFLGICVGLQLLFEASEEMGTHRGLGILPGQVKRFSASLTVPHMGWNQIEQQRPHPLLTDVPEGAFVYFANSYHAVTDDESIIVATTEYGTHFPSVVARENVWAIQFHPEKSQETGLTMLRNFAENVYDRLPGH